MLWKTNNHIPQLGEKVRYKDHNGIIHIGIFDMLMDDWRMIDFIGGITAWQNVVEWQEIDCPFHDIAYQDWILDTMDSELA